MSSTVYYSVSDDIVSLFFNLNDIESSCVLLVLLCAFHFRVGVYAEINCFFFFFLGIVVEI